MRIISLLPSATDIVTSLGSGNQVVGRSIVKTIVKPNSSSKDINDLVSSSLKLGKSLYIVDKKQFVNLKPDLVITQQLCKVCSITPTDIQEAIRDCRPIPKIISLHPHSIKNILADIEAVGNAIGKEIEAKRLVQELNLRIKKIQDQTKLTEKRPRIYCMEWLDPPYNAGHWVPEQVKISGGIDDLAISGKDSIKLIWEKIVKYNPEILIIMPCGFSIKRTQKEITILTQRPEWREIAAVKTNQVFLVNGPKYFNSSGPKVIDGIELLTRIVHPEIRTKHFTRSDFVNLTI